MGTFQAADTSTTAPTESSNTIEVTVEMEDGVKLVVWMILAHK